LKTSYNLNVQEILNEFLELHKNTHYNSTESKLGLLGEIIVKHIFNAEMSEDLYDSSKDMSVAGIDIEVKTQVRWKN
jgi:predicted nucleotide-binding protein (sugar kinase/HSP70/actin superfamily)